MSRGAGINFQNNTQGTFQVDWIEVGSFNECGLLQELNKFFGLKIKSLVRLNTYLFVHRAPWENSQQLSLGLPFLDPVIHRAAVNTSLAKQLELKFDRCLISMLRPGTSDAEGEVALEQAIARLQAERYAEDQGFFIKQYFLSGELTTQQAQQVFDFLANPELCLQKQTSYSEYQSGVSLPLPIVSLEKSGKVAEIALSAMSLEDLRQLNKKHSLAASDEELLAFQEMYADPEFIGLRKQSGLTEEATDVEMETWFGLRSEHCFHKEFNAEITLETSFEDPIFEQAAQRGIIKKIADKNYLIDKGIFSAFIREPAEKIFEQLEARGCNWIASMFSDNAGVAYYDENFMFAIKAETHNSPSNKEPVQGAKTGLNGNFRDIMGTMRGSFDIIAGGFLFCTGDPDYQGWLPKGVKHPYVILKGITQGVREAGNEMQVPTLWGNVIIDPRYVAKCLVFCGAVGWSAVKNGKIDFRDKSPQVGDLVMIAGQAVGIDGIHGATESSLSASAEISLGHVQADFSFIQAKVKEFMLAASRQGLFSAVTDCGAMGLGSSSHEIARDTGGLDMDLAKHPQKYQGILPWQINCSETQDRMLLVVHPENRMKVLSLAKKFKVDVSELGVLTNNGYIVLRYDQKLVGLIDINKLFSKEPRKQMLAAWTQEINSSTPSRVHEKIAALGFEKTIQLLVAEPDLASKEWFFRQKDFSVKGGTILSPLSGAELAVDSDASIQKPLDTEGKDFGALAYALGVAPKLSDNDPYYAAQNSFVEAVGKLIAVGARLPDFNIARWDSWAVCGNYCQPNSDYETALFPEVAKENLAALVREGLGVREAVERLGIPVISGKDSMKCSCVYEVPEDFSFEDIPAELTNQIFYDTEARKIEIHDPETYLVTAAAKIEDYRKAIDQSFKKAGDLIFLIGKREIEYAGTQVAQAIQRSENFAIIASEKVPAVDFDHFIKRSRLIEQLIDGELLASCAYVNHGGVAFSLLKAAWAGALGVELDLSTFDGAQQPSWQAMLFSETPGSYLVTIAPSDYDRFAALTAGFDCYCLGRVSNQQELHLVSPQEQVCLTLDKLNQIYRRKFAFSQLRSGGVK